LFVALSFAGGAPVHAQQTAPRRLTLREAISLALKQNLSVRVASAQVEELEGTRERRGASLLPHVNGNSLANRENIDLRAMGISFPTIPPIMGITFPTIPAVVGPFAHYDFRLSASQSLIDRHSYHNWKASEKQEEAAKLDYQDARDLVIRQGAGLYLDAQASAAEAAAAESRVTTSETLEKLARDQHAQGLATAVDVVRAQVQLARDQQNLLVARNTYQTSLLVLAHFLGLSPGAPLDLAEPLKFHHVESTDADQALHSASRRDPTTPRFSSSEIQLSSSSRPRGRAISPPCRLTAIMEPSGALSPPWREPARFRERSPSPCLTGTARERKRNSKAS